MLTCSPTWRGRAATVSLFQVKFAAGGSQFHGHFDGLHSLRVHVASRWAVRTRIFSVQRFDVSARLGLADSKPQMSSRSFHVLLAQGSERQSARSRLPPGSSRRVSHRRARRAGPSALAWQVFEPDSLLGVLAGPSARTPTRTPVYWNFQYNWPACFSTVESLCPCVLAVF